LHLPDIDGISLLREFRSVPAHRVTPMAVITGDHFLTDDMSRELIELGAQLHFKPVWTEDLLVLTYSLLQGTSN
jgi:CheY-like chemotaxis protein